jgi:hypothetical protein
MPDDMLEDVITVAKKALDENDFEANGVEVNIISLYLSQKSFFLLIDRKISEEVHG